jgi:hypothetical protein
MACPKIIQLVSNIAKWGFLVHVNRVFTFFLFHYFFFIVYIKGLYYCDQAEWLSISFTLTRSRFKAHQFEQAPGRPNVT